MRRRSLNYLFAVFVSLGAASAILASEPTFGCGTCTVSSNSSENTGECVACADGSGDACIRDSGTPKCKIVN